MQPATVKIFLKKTFFYGNKKMRLKVMPSKPEVSESLTLSLTLRFSWQSGHHALSGAPTQNDALTRIMPPVGGL